MLKATHCTKILVSSDAASGKVALLEGVVCVWACFVSTCSQICKIQLHLVLYQITVCVVISLVAVFCVSSIST
jgi:hypothetical protein